MFLTKMATTQTFILLLIFLFEVNSVVNFNQHLERKKRSLDSENNNEFPKPSEVCQQLNKTFNSQTKNENFGKEIHLDSEKSILQLAWTGENHEKIIIVTTNQTINTVYLSNADFSFKDITTTIFNIHPSSNIKINIVQHPIDPITTYLLILNNTMDAGSTIYISKDASVTYTRIDLEFIISPLYLLFHPSNQDLILALDTSNRKLYLSVDKGLTWHIKASDVTYAKWSKNPLYPTDIYILRNTNIKSFFFGLFTQSDPKDNVLYRINDLTTNNITLLKQNVYSIGSENEFLYASIISTNDKGEDERWMQVSTNGGRMWNRVQLPTITSERFYSILDLSQGLIFLHVDNPGDTGRGVLYTSDATGIVFSKSLENHLYPNLGNTVDFYRVASSNGTFITSILSQDDSVQTVISFDRGSEWHPIPRPPNVPCMNESLVCNLHIHSSFSASHNINAPLPLSSTYVPGFIIAHGHVAESLQTSDPDVYVSRDGGHNWNFALKGPHKYQIADQGNLIFAIPSTIPFPKTLYFSTDGGRCWVSHRFTQEDINFKEMLVTPDNKEKTLAIWGFNKDKKWHSFVLNFEEVIPQKCMAEAYEEWHPTSHQDNTCVLGVSERMKRVKADSWCLNEASFSPFIFSKPCECTQDDYSCDYGYKRVGERCVEDVNVVEQLLICNKNHHQKMVPVGYHKIPGDQCQGGFAPPASKWVDMDTECETVVHDAFRHGIENIDKMKAEKNTETKKKSKRMSILFIIFFFLIILLTTISLVHVGRKYKLLQRQPSFKYSSIRSRDEEEGLMAEEENEDEEHNDDDDAGGRRTGGSMGYNKIGGPTLDFETQNVSQQQQQQTGYIHPKLMALTNPHLLNNNNKFQKNVRDDDDDDVAKLIPDSDVELLQ